MIRLIVDSTFGLEEEYIKTNNIKVVELSLKLDGIENKEGREADWQEFFERFEASKNFPTTSQPNPEDFSAKISEILSEDSSAEILILTISETLSGTINSAKIAVNDFVSNKIAVIDSTQTSVGARILVEEIFQYIANGITFDELLKVIPIIQENVNIQFIPVTMEYFIRGGRMGKLQGFIGNAIHLRPVFSFHNGAIKIVKKAIGMGSALSFAISNLPEKIKKIYVIYIYHNENVSIIVNKLKQVRNICDVKAVAVSPVLGAHLGIGTIGIATLAEY